MEYRKRRAIALLVDSVSSDYAALLHQAVKRAANARAVDVMTFTGLRLNPDNIFEATQNKIFELVTPARVDGVIVVSSVLSHFTEKYGVEALLRRLSPLPVCSVGLEIDGVPSIIVDNRGGMKRGILHLIDEHHRRRIVFIAAQPNSVESNERLSGYRDALESRGIPFDPELIEHGDFTVPGGVDAIRRILDKGIKFDAVAAANDYMALATLDVLAAKGLKLPEDIPVLGFDDVSNAVCSRPALTTLRQPMWWLGDDAVRAVLDQFEKGVGGLVHVGEIELVRRDSCGCGISMGEDQPSSSPIVGGLTQFLEAEREALEKIMMESVLVPNNALGNWANALFRSLVDELEGNSGKFQECLESTLEKAEDAGANLEEFQRMITGLRAALSHSSINDGGITARLERIWHVARLVIATAALRGMGRQRIGMQYVAAYLGRCGERLSTTMSLPLLKQAIVDELPVFGIDHLAVSLFQSNFGSPLVPFLVMKDRQLVAVDGEAFLPELLAPQAFFESNRCWNSVVVPLTFEGESLGVAVFGDHAHPSAYSGLRSQIGSAIQVAALHRSMVTQVEARERLEQTRVREEARVAAQIQTTMCPTIDAAAEFEFSHTSIPAAEAGGDYYDIIPVEQGTWLTVGDVTGHGLGAGLIMLMLQSVIAGLIQNQPEIRPSRVISVVNEVIYDNVRHRLKRDEHATLVALHCSASGQVTYAGAHEPIVIYRAATGRCEVVTTSGIWVGVLADATALTEDNSFELEEGDVLVLVTDGLTEARNAHHEQFGLLRLVSVVEAAKGQPVAVIRDKILAAVKAWSVTQEDDVTLLIARYHAPLPS